jgi:hypothetical protein
MRKHPGALTVYKELSAMTIYLYVKTHNTTGLKYLGKTVSQNPHLYPGSGIYWTRHLKTHGYDYTTKIIKECQTKEELKEWGLYYSQIWNVVESNEWANLRPETGDGGCKKGIKRSDQWHNKLRNKVWSEKALQNLKEIGIKSAALRKGKPWSKNMRESRLNTYIEKNLEIAKEIIQLDNQNYNKLTISKKLNISWEKVKYTLKYKNEFNSRIK